LINLVKVFLQLDLFPFQLSTHLPTLLCDGKGITEVFSYAGGIFSPCAKEFISEEDCVPNSERSPFAHL